MDKTQIKTLLFCILSFLFIFPLQAQNIELSSGRKAVKRSGDVLFIATPITCLATTVLLKDWEGLKQGAFAGATTMGVTYLLKYTVSKERPDGSDKHSFPSAHSAVTFTGAAFLQKRYGWKWGLPAYAVASYVGWSRTYAKKHDWWDVVTGAAIGVGSAYLFTRPFADKYHLSISPVATNQHMGFHASLLF